MVKYVAQLLPLLLIIWEYRLKYVDKDGRTIEHKRARKIVLFLAICICVLGFGSALLDDANKAKEKRKLAQSNTNLVRELAEIKRAQTNLSKEVSQGVNELLIQATNASISDAALKIEIREKEAKVSQAIPVNTDSPDFGAFATNYEERIKLTQLKKEKDRREAVQAAQIAAEKARQEAERQEGSVANKTDPVFDYAVRTLQSMFADHVKQVGEKNLTSTYVGLPSMAGLPSQNIAQLKSESKFPWVCEISRTKWPRQLIVKYADYKWSNWGETNFMYQFGSGLAFNPREKMWAAKLWRDCAIDPELTLGSGTNYVITLTVAFEGENFDTISTSITVQSKLSEIFPHVDQKQPYTNYVESINSALGAFFGVQAAVVARAYKL
jgi:hypothetical protein